MADLKFKLRYSKRDESSIYYRYVRGRDLDVTFKLPYKIPTSSWSQAKQKVIQSKLPPGKEYKGLADSLNLHSHLR